MARNWKQRFNINPNTGQATGTADEMALGGRDDVRQAEMKAAADLANQVTSAQEALEEFEQTVRRAGVEGGFRDEVVQAIVDDFRQRLGVNASGSPGGTDEFDQRYAAGQIGDKLTAIAEEFQRGERSAEEASARMERVLDIFGEMAQLTDEEYAAVRNQFREAVGNPTRGGGAGGGGGVDTGGGATTDGSNRGGADNKDDAGKGERPDATSSELVQQLISRLGGRIGLTPDVVKMLGGAGGGVAGGLGGLLGGLGGGAGGGGGGLMGAAGSVAGPLALVTAGSKIMESFYRSVQDTTRQMTAVATSIAGNDGIGAVTGAIEGASRQVTSKIPILGDALQAQVEMYTGFLKAFDQVTEAFKRRGEELRRFDGGIAAASAESKTNLLLADIREAQNLGNEYAAIIREKTELQVEFQRALEPIKAAVMQQLIPLLRSAVGILSLYNEGTEKIGSEVKRVSDRAIPLLSNLSGIGVIIDLIRAATGKQKDDRQQTDALAQILRLAEADLSVLDERMAPPVEQSPMGIDLFK